MESFLNKCSNVSCSQNSFSKDKHTGTGEVCSTEDTPAAWRLLCVQRCGCHLPWHTWKRWQVPHLIFWAGPPEAITHNAGDTHPQPSGYRDWLSHTSCSTSLWPPASGRFLTLLMWLHFAHSINMKGNPISKIHLGEWLNPSTQQGSFPDHQGRAEQHHGPDFSARA